MVGGRQLSEAVVELQAGTQHRILPVPELPSVSADRHAVVDLLLDQPRGVVRAHRSRSDVGLVFFDARRCASAVNAARLGVCLSVRPSVSLSQADVSSKRLNASSVNRFSETKGVF